MRMNGRDGTCEQSERTHGAQTKRPDTTEGVLGGACMTCEDRGRILVTESGQKGPVWGERCQWGRACRSRWELHLLLVWTVATQECPHVKFHQRAGDPATCML